VIEFYIKDATKCHRDDARVTRYTEDLLLSTRPNWAGFGDLSVRISAVTVARHTDYARGHWSIFLHTDIGHLIKVDLVQDYYRVIYGADAPQVKNYVSVEKLSFVGLRTLNDVFQLVFSLATKFGAWRSIKVPPYGCQDFVIAFLSYFGVSDSQLFPYELRRTVSRWRPPLITEYNETELKVFGLRVFIRGY